MRLHLLAIPHTVTHPDFTSCAFTQKVWRFSRMMRPHGWEIVHYGIEGSDSGATEDVVLMTQEEHQNLLGHPYHQQNQSGGGFYGDDAVDNNSVYRAWNLYARDEMRDRVAPCDLILLPFGHAHAAAIRGLPVLAAGAGAIESGIGYYDTLLPWRIYESEAVRHGALGKEARYGVSGDSPRLEFVVPNYYNPDEWPEGSGGDAVVFLGRLTEGKGIRLLLDIARARPDVPFKIAGQGSIEPFGDVPPNVEVIGPLTHERAAYLGNARAIIAPSRYSEPFCGVVVEAALCGTPAITSDFGAFTETVDQGLTGFRCQTMRQWCEAIDQAGDLSRRYTRLRAQTLYSTDRVGMMYDRVLRVVKDRVDAGAFPHLGW